MNQQTLHLRMQDPRIVPGIRTVKNYRERFHARSLIAFQNEDSKLDQSWRQL